MAEFFSQIFAIPSPDSYSAGVTTNDTGKGSSSSKGGKKSHNRTLSPLGVFSTLSAAGISEHSRSTSSSESDGSKSHTQATQTTHTQTTHTPATHRSSSNGSSRRHRRRRSPAAAPERPWRPRSRDNKLVRRRSLNKLKSSKEHLTPVHSWSSGEEEGEEDDAPKEKKWQSKFSKKKRPPPPSQTTTTTNTPAITTKATTKPPDSNARRPHHPNAPINLGDSIEISQQYLEESMEMSVVTLPRELMAEDMRHTGQASVMNNDLVKQFLAKQQDGSTNLATNQPLPSHASLKNGTSDVSSGLYERISAYATRLLEEGSIYRTDSRVTNSSTHHSNHTTTTTSNQNSQYGTNHTHSEEPTLDTESITLNKIPPESQAGPPRRHAWPCDPTAEGYSPQGTHGRPPIAPIAPNAPNAPIAPIDPPPISPTSQRRRVTRSNSPAPLLGSLSGSLGSTGRSGASGTSGPSGPSGASSPDPPARWDQIDTTESTGEDPSGILVSSPTLHNLDSTSFSKEEGSSHKDPHSSASGPSSLNSRRLSLGSNGMPTMPTHRSVSNTGKSSEGSAVISQNSQESKSSVKLKSSLEKGDLSNPPADLHRPFDEASDYNSLKHSNPKLAGSNPNCTHSNNPVDTEDPKQSKAVTFNLPPPHMAAPLLLGPPLDYYCTLDQSSWKQSSLLPPVMELWASVESTGRGLDEWDENNWDEKREEDLVGENIPLYVTQEWLHEAQEIQMNCAEGPNLETVQEEVPPSPSSDYFHAILNCETDADENVEIIDTVVQRERELSETEAKEETDHAPKHSSSDVNYRHRSSWRSHHGTMAYKPPMFNGGSSSPALSPLSTPAGISNSQSHSIEPTASFDDPVLQDRQIHGDGKLPGMAQGLTMSLSSLRGGTLDIWDEDDASSTSQESEEEEEEVSNSIHSMENNPARMEEPMQSAAINIQSYVRMWLQQDRYRKLCTSALVIQPWMRSCICRKRYLEEVKLRKSYYPGKWKAKGRKTQEEIQLRMTLSI